MTQPQKKEKSSSLTKILLRCVSTKTGSYIITKKWRYRMSVMELMEQWDWDFLCPNDIRLTDNCKFCNICGDKRKLSEQWKAERKPTHFSCCKMFVRFRENFLITHFMLLLRLILWLPHAIFNLRSLVSCVTLQLFIPFRQLDN